MAYRLRHISNKLPAISSKVIQNNHVISFEQNRKHHPIPCEYKNAEECSLPVKVNEQCRAPSTILKSYLDNSESSSDIVTKENYQLVNYKDRCNVLWCSPTPREDVSKCRSPGDYNKSNDSFSGKPSPEKLEHVYETLKDSIPKLFTDVMDYSIYHPDLVFENNIRGITTVGLFDYVRQLALVRTLGHIRFAFVRMEVIKITKHDEDSTIKVRWRIKGLTAWKAMNIIWKYKFQEIREHLNRAEAWYDGFSTFHVNSNGEVVKHVADKMQPDSDSVAGKLITPLEGAKLAMMVPKVPF